MFPNMEFVKLLNNVKKSNESLVESIESGYAKLFEAIDKKPTAIEVFGGRFDIDDEGHDKNDATVTFSSNDGAVLSLYNKSANFKDFLIASMKSLFDEFGESFKHNGILVTITTNTNVTGTSWTSGSKGSYWEPEEPAMFEDADYDTTISSVQLTVWLDGSDERTFDMPGELIFQDKKDMQILTRAVENYLSATEVIDDMLTQQGEDVLEEESFHRSMRRSRGRYADMDI